MPLVRTREDDGRFIEAPQYALDKGYTGLRLCDAIVLLQPEIIRTTFRSGIAAVLSPHNVRNSPAQSSFDFCEPFPVDLLICIERGRDRTGRVVDPDNANKRLLTDNKDVDTWVCILKAGLCGVDAIEGMSNHLLTLKDGVNSGKVDSTSLRADILRVFLHSGHEFISQYPDKEVPVQRDQLQGAAAGEVKPPNSATTSIRSKAHDLFEKIIAFVLRTLPLFPIMIPHVPGLMWFGRSSPWEHELARDVDVLGAAEAPRFRHKAAADQPLKSGATSHFFHGTGADRLFPIMRTNVQPHFTSTSGGRYDAQGIPGWYGHGLYFSEHLQTAQAYAAGGVEVTQRPLMVIEAAGCLKTYEKTSEGHECTTLVMDSYKQVATHTAAIQTKTFASILGRPHAAPVVRGVFLCDGAVSTNPLGRASASPRSRNLNDNLQMSVGPWADKFWKEVHDYYNLYVGNQPWDDALLQMADVVQAFSPQTLFASLPTSSHDSAPRPVPTHAALAIDASPQPLIASSSAALEGEETPKFEDDDTPSAGFVFTDDE